MSAVTQSRLYKEPSTQNRVDELLIRQLTLEERYQLVTRRRNEMNAELDRIGNELFEIQESLTNLTFVLQNPQMQFRGQNIYKCEKCAFVTDNKIVFKKHRYDFHSY